MIGIGLDITRAGQTVSFSLENLRRGSRVVQDFTVRPNRLFSDTAGTTLIAGPGAEVAAMRDSRGVLVATQATAAARPKYAVQPAVGVRNRLPNNRGDGAVVGVLGSGGALPGGMGVTGIAAGSIEVLSLAAKNGRPNTKVRISGTPTNNVNIIFTGSQVIPAVAGQVWTSSVWAQMTAGSVANLNPITLNTTTHAANGDFISSFANNFIGTIGDDVRRVVSSTLVGATIAFVRSQVQLAWTSGAVDITLDISAPQLEQAGAATDVQIVGANGFDVSEAGVRPVHRLQYDGMDDFMDLATAWTSGAAYTLAAAHNLHDSDTFNGTAGTIFGNTTLTSGRLFRGNRARMNIETDASNRISAETAVVAGRVVDLVRMISGGEAFYRNGVLSTVFPTSDGYPEPVFNTLGRLGTGYAVGSFFGGVMVSDGDTPLTEAERLMTERYLAYSGGITL